MAVQFIPKILGLNVGMFGTVSGSLGLYLRTGFDPEIDVFGFFFVFWWLGAVFSPTWKW